MVVAEPLPPPPPPQLRVEVRLKESGGLRVQLPPAAPEQQLVRGPSYRHDGSAPHLHMHDHSSPAVAVAVVVH